MEWKRKAARVIAVLAIALGAGHLAQTLAARHATTAKAPASAALKERPKAIQQVAAGPEAVSPAPVAPAPVVEMPKIPLVMLAPPAFPAPLPAPAEPAAAADAAAEPAAQPVAEACPVTLDLVNEPAAMIGLTLIAPCHAGERVVLQHAGLTVTAMTTATGALITGLPALETAAGVTVVFADGSRAESQLDVPELAGLRRFGIQWQGEDSFDLHAFEAGAAYDAPGDVSAANPRAPSSLLPASQGFMTLLGDPAAPSPLLAAIYTWPADPAVRADAVVEAAVTDATCGREMLGQTLSSAGGAVTVQDLSVSMPECDAAGGYLVLKNLAPEMNIAAAN